MNYYAYSSKEPLVSCEFPALHRAIGVRISDPFFHQGMKRMYVEMTYETIAVNTVEFGGNHPATEVEALAVEFTAAAIKALDKVIAELAAHRERLAAEKERLEREGTGLNLEGEDAPRRY